VCSKSSLGPSIVIFIIDTLIPTHLEEFGKIGLRFAQVYPVNSEELRIVFHFCNRVFDIIPKDLSLLLLHP
jgi:hypothetical protein